MAATREDVLVALKTITDPVSGANIIDAGVVKALTVQDGAVRFVLEIVPSQAAAYAPVKIEADSKLRALPGMQSVSVVLTAIPSTRTSGIPAS